MADKDRELQLNDPAHTATREATTRSERREAADEPLHEQSKKAQIAGGAASGLGGAAAGAGAGVIVGGPIGAAIGAIAGAVGGWWVGHASVVAGDWTDHDEAYYRERHQELGGPADRTFETSRPAYQLGHVASRNPDYKGRTFDEIEPELRRGWTDELRDRHGTWDSAREHARVGYERPRGSTTSERSESGKHNISAHEPRASGGDGLRSPGGTGY
jgi:hypothetical protein